jgi:hypothetical protein
MTAPATVPDHVVAQLGPVLGWKECSYSDFDLVRVGFGSPSEAADESSEMGVHRDAGNAEAIAKYYIGSLPADAGESH